MSKDSRKNNCEDSLTKNRLAERVFKVDKLQVIPERILNRIHSEPSEAVLNGYEKKLTNISERGKIAEPR